MERLIRFVVTNRSFTLLFFLIVVVAAWVKLPEIKVSQQPAVKVPMLMINIVLPGASAKEIEQRVITLVEDKLQNTRGIYKFTTFIYNSYSLIKIQYDYGVDIDDEYVDVNSKLNNIKPDLPEEVEITVLKQSPVDLVVSFVVGISSQTATWDELRQTADALGQRLRQLSSVEDVEEIHPDEEVKIDLDLARVEASRLSISAVERAVTGNNQYLPTGTFNVGDKALSVLAFGSGYESLEEIRDTMLINSDGKALSLSDVAMVKRAHEPDRVIAKVDGKPAVLVTMKLAEGANIFDARREVQNAVDDISLPESMQLHFLYDEQTGVDSKMSELGLNILQGIVILAIVLLFAVGLRSAFIIASMLPAALFLSIVGLAFTEYGLQEISLAGFIISLGLIVDNGIVVTENAYKLNHYNGLSHEEAAVRGTSSVVMPLLSSTATTALAFAPLYLLTSPTGLFLHSLVAVIWLCLAASLVAAIMVSSVLIARIGTENKVPFLPSPPSFLISLIPFRDITYRNTLSFFIRHPFALILGVAGLLAVTGIVASRLPVIVFPNSEEPYFTVSIKAPLDRGEKFTEELTDEIALLVQNKEGIERCSTMTGSSFPMVHTGIARVPDRRNNAQIFCSVTFRDAHRMDDLLLELNQTFKEWSPVADIDAESFTVGTVKGAGDVVVRVSGPRIDEARHLAEDLEQHIRAAGIEGIGEIDNDAESRYFALDIRFQKRRASALGVDRRAVDQVLSLITHGREIDKFRDGSGEEYPIVLRVEADPADPLNVFDRIYVPTLSGAKVPLSQVVEVSFREDDFDIGHYMYKPSVSININSVPGYNVRPLTADVKAVVDEFELPTGFAVLYDGKVENQKENFGGVGKYVGVIGLIVLAIFVFQFGSVAQPIIICAAIPLSFIGAFLLLYPTDQPLSFLAFIGLTSLMGIVINNSILLVDEGNQLRELDPDLPVSEAAIRAGINRFMPILLTSLTSIAGLLPLAMGSSMFKALAIVVIGGLSTSTFLTLICLPVIYAYATRPTTRSARVTHDWVGKSRLGESDPFSASAD